MLVRLASRLTSPLPKTVQAAKEREVDATYGFNQASEGVLTAEVERICQH